MRKFIFCFAFFAFVSCKVVPTSDRIESELVVGKSKKDDVRKAFGKPNMRSSSAQGFNTWTYNTNGSYFKKQVYTIFYFDKNGVLVNYEQNDLNVK